MDEPLLELHLATEHGPVTVCPAGHRPEGEGVVVHWGELERLRGRPPELVAAVLAVKRVLGGEVIDGPADRREAEREREEAEQAEARRRGAGRAAAAVAARARARVRLPVSRGRRG